MIINLFCNSFGYSLVAVSLSLSISKGSFLNKSNNQAANKCFEFTFFLIYWDKLVNGKTSSPKKLLKTLRALFAFSSTVKSRLHTQFTISSDDTMRVKITRCDSFCGVL